VHWLVSVQVSPFIAAGLEHIPFAVLHVPGTWHWSIGMQLTCVPVQTPAWQLSLWVQGLLSLHGVPLLAGGLEHIPVPGLHVPATWHWSIAVHEPGFDPTHVPFPSQAYVRHWFDPLQVVPTFAGGLEQMPVVASHVPATWQPSLAVQVTEGVPVHTPATQAYESHLLGPVHGVESGFCVGAEHIPVPGAHVPGTLHWGSAGAVTVQLTELIPVQTPATHA
jgi:hypothetical protein